MHYYVFVDNSNLWIEGQHAAAVKQGFVKSMYEAHAKNLNDFGWRVDFGKLLSLCCNGQFDKVKTAFFVGSEPPKNDTLWDAARRAGFEVKVVQRNYWNHEKGVDTGIVARIDKHLFKESQEGDTFVLVSGDADYIPALENIKEEKRKSVVVFWSNTNDNLKEFADEFINLNDHFDEITK